MRKRYIFTVVISVVLLLAIGLSSTAWTSAGGSKTFKIGYISMQTGATSGLGPFEKAAVNYALEEAKWEVAGKKIELVFEDGASDVNVCVDKARKMVERDNVNVIIGPLLTDAFIAVSAYLKRHGIPLIYPFAIASEAVAAGAGNVFAVNGQDLGTFYPLGTYAAEKGYKTATILYHDIAIGKNFLKGFTAGIEAKGGSVIQSQAIPMGTKDYYPNLLALKQADAAAFFFTAVDVPIFVKQYRDYGAKTPLWVGKSDLLSVPSLQDLADKGLGIVSQAGWNRYLDIPKNKKFVENYTKATGNAPNDAVEGNYQAIQLVLEAVRQAKGNTSAKALIKALLATNMDSTRGHVTMSPEGYCISDHYIVEVVKNQTAPIYDYKVVEKTTRQIIK